MAVRILAAADLHLGRRPTGFPPEVGERISPVRALERLVDAAIGRKVALVLLAGDLVDRRNASHEAWGPLDRALHRLREAGIAAVAVAGNHDAEALPLIARELGGGHLVLLGEGGEWERWTLRGGEGAPVVHIDGWSFPEQHHPLDPTEGWTPEPFDATPAIGLLHCDLGVPRSPYAPVAEARLRALGHDAWVLGHIHVPTLRSGSGAAPLLYPGSPQGLDPGETGAHGARLLEVDGGGVRVSGFLSLATGRYDELDVAVDGVADRDALEARLRGVVTAHVEEVVNEAGALEALQLRLSLKGRSPIMGELGPAVAALDDFDPGAAHGLRVRVDPRARIEARPARDLARLAEDDDATAILARLILELEEGRDLDGDLSPWTDRVRQELDGVAGQSLLQEAGLLDPVASEELRVLMRHQAARLLDELLDQEAGG